MRSTCVKPSRSIPTPFWKDAYQDRLRGGDGQQVDGDRGQRIAIDRKASVSSPKLSASTKAITIGSQLRCELA
jgi:hypothetical protein